MKATPPPPSVSRTHPRLRVGIILTRRFTLSAFANFVDVLRLAADEGDRSRPIHCSWRVLSADMQPVRSSSGIAVFPDERFGDPTRFDYVVVVGGLIDEEIALDRVTASFLERSSQAGVALVGLCTGAFILHRAGLMNGYRCCVSWFHRDDFLEEFDGLVPVTDRIFVVDRDRLTSSGGASSAHLAAYLVDRHIGTSAARKSLNIMIIEEAKTADDPQPGLPIDLNTSDPLIRRALAAMQEDMGNAPNVSRIASRLGISRRKLERHFAAAFHLTPTRSYLRLRLAKVRLLLANTDRSLGQIAAETGFSDASHLVRIFRKEEGMTPIEWRRARKSAAS